MASATTRVIFRVVVGILAILVLFYVGRPLYWKISATVQEIRENKRTVKQGISQIVFEAQKSVGWFHDESGSGARQNRRVRKMLEVKVQILDARGFRACLAGYVMNAFGFFWSLGPSQNPKKEEFSNNPMFVPKMCSKSKFKYLMLEDLEPAWLAM
ncbi:hypothetical protein H0E87_015216 [Populus deltoides]|uniref:Uncharacterized protein n=1 Tax=Populus deltoides TaxID=3696 RepID=A0A8T2Y460_POPDE|nr:hypothetical protein H0E87_015216 [Populus deltoides]